MPFVASVSLSDVLLLRARTPTRTMRVTILVVTDWPMYSSHIHNSGNDTIKEGY